MDFRSPITAATVRALIAVVITAVTGWVTTTLSEVDWGQFAPWAIAEMAALRIALEGWLFDTRKKTLQG